MIHITELVLVVCGVGCFGAAIGIVIASRRFERAEAEDGYEQEFGPKV